MVDVAALARDVLEGFRAIAAGRPTELEVRGDVHARIDAALLRRVLANLVGNGLHYGSSVRLHVEGRPESVAVHVQSDGPAIPPEVRDRLFDPWARLDAEGAPTRATGLGLSFCRLAVESHDGRLWLESGEERNVVFAFDLPRGAGP